MIEYDDWAKIHFITDEKGNPIPIDEANVIGEPVGYSKANADDKKIQFSRLS